MKSNRWFGTKDARLLDVEIPSCGKNDILCKVRYCGICGSDTQAYHRENPIYWEGVSWGHETITEVVEVGEDVRDIHVGDRVFPYIILGGFSEYLIVENAVLNENVFLVDNSISDLEATLIEPLAVGYHAAVRSGANADDNVIVFGAGFIGLATAIFLRNKGANVLIVDMVDARLALAKTFGLHICNSSVENLDAVVEDLFGLCDKNGIRGPEGKAYNVPFFVEATGAGVVLQSIWEKAYDKAVITLVAMHEGKRELELTALTFHEFSLIGSRGFTPENVGDVMEVIRSKSFPMETLVSGIYELEDMNIALDAAVAPEKAGKTIIRIAAE